MWAPGRRPGRSRALSSAPTPCFSLGPDPGGRPGEGTAGAPHPRLRARAGAHHRLLPAANLCLRAHAPRAPGSPASRALHGKLGLEGRLSRTLGFPESGRGGLGGCWPGGGRRGRAGARAVPRAHSWAWALFGCAHTCAGRGVPGRAHLRPRRSGETWGDWGRQGGGFPGLAAPQVRAPGVLAPRPGSPDWDLLGLARRGVEPTQAPRAGARQQLGRGGCVEPRVTEGPEHPGRGERRPRRALHASRVGAAAGRSSAGGRLRRSGPASASAQSGGPGSRLFFQSGVHRAARDAGGAPGSGGLESKPVAIPPGRLPAACLPVCGCVLYPRLSVVAPAQRRARREGAALRGGVSFPPCLSPAFWYHPLQPEASGARSCLSEKGSVLFLPGPAWFMGRGAVPFLPLHSGKQGWKPGWRGGRLWCSPRSSPWDFPGKETGSPCADPGRLGCFAWGCLMLNMPCY